MILKLVVKTNIDDYIKVIAKFWYWLEKKKKQGDDNKDQNTMNDPMEDLNMNDDYNSHFKALYGLVKDWYNVDLKYNN